MGENSKIEWCDHTMNPWIGCQKVAAGCSQCYAESFANRYGKAKWGPNGTRVKTTAEYWRKPIKWNKEAERAGVRARVFCASLADVFEDWGNGWDGPILNSDFDQLWECCTCGFVAAYEPLQTLRKQGLEDCCACSTGPDFVPLGMKSLRRQLFALIDATPNLDWLLLTKRPENIRSMLVPESLENVPGHISQNEGDGKRIRKRGNLWLGTSVATQEDADRNVPPLLKCRDLAPVLFVSAEPLLGPIDVSPWTGTFIYRCECPEFGGYHRTESELIFCGGGDYTCPKCRRHCKPEQSIDQIIVGGESGHGARPMNPQWARDIRDQCQAAGVAFFFKQWGEWAWTPHGFESASGKDNRMFLMPDGSRNDGSGPESVTMSKVGKKVAGRLLDGRTWDEFPHAEARP